MAAFSYQYCQSLLLDSVHIPLLPQQIEEMSHASSCFLHYYKPDAIAESSEIETRAYDSSGSLVSVRKPDGGVGISRPQVTMEKKRKIKDQSFLASVQSEDSKKIRYSRKQKKPIGMKQKEAKKLLKACEIKRSCEEASVGYIHVRARRGQATDSHSLAERVRREKIRERMKRLQALVPGCDKVTGNALILDEIINYVQSLQNKVEFLSMKLASLNPILYDFGVDLDVQMNQMERLEGLVQDSQLAPSISQTSPFHPTAQSLLHGQGPMAFSPLINVGEERQGFLNQVVLDSKCSFH